MSIAVSNSYSGSHSVSAWAFGIAAGFGFASIALIADDATVVGVVDDPGLLITVPGWLIASAIGVAASALEGCGSQTFCEGQQPSLHFTQDPINNVPVPVNAGTVDVSFNLTASRCHDETNGIEVSLDCGDDAHSFTWAPVDADGKKTFTCSYDVSQLSASTKRVVTMSARDTHQNPLTVKNDSTDVWFNIPNEADFRIALEHPQTTNVGVPNTMVLKITATDPESEALFSDLHPRVVIWEGGGVTYAEGDAEHPLTCEQIMAGDHRALQCTLQHTFLTEGTIGIQAFAVLSETNAIVANETVQVFGPLAHPRLDISLSDNDVNIWENPIQITAALTPNPLDPVVSMMPHFTLIDQNTGAVAMSSASTGTVTMSADQTHATWEFDLPVDFIPPGTATQRNLWVHLTADVDTEQQEPTALEASNQNQSLTVRRPGQPTLSASPADEYRIYDNPIRVPVEILESSEDILESATLNYTLERDGVTIGEGFITTTSTSAEIDLSLDPNAIPGGLDDTHDFILNVSGTADTLYNNATTIAPISIPIHVRRPSRPTASVDLADEYRIQEPVSIPVHIQPNTPDTIQSASLTYTVRRGDVIIRSGPIETTTETTSINFTFPADTIPNGSDNTADLTLEITGSVVTQYNESVPLASVSQILHVRRPGQAGLELDIPDNYIVLPDEIPTILAILIQDLGDPLHPGNPDPVTYNFSLQDPSTGAAITSSGDQTSSTWVPTIPPAFLPPPGSSRTYIATLTASVDTTYNNESINASQNKTITIAQPAPAIATPILNVSVPYSAVAGEEFTFQIIGPEPNTTYTLTEPGGIGFTTTTGDTPPATIDIPITVATVMPLATFVVTAERAGASSEFVHQMAITPAPVLPAPIMNLVVNPAFCPVIPFDADPGNDSCTVLLDATGSYAVDADLNPIPGGIAEYTVNWGDGVIDTQSAGGGIFSHIYTIPGFFSVRVDIVDINGRTTTRFVNVQTSI